MIDFLSLAIVFALCSVVLGGINDVVFKRYSANPRSRGIMISGIGLVWAVLLLLDVSFRGGSIELNQSALLFAAVAGFFVTVANILLLESLRHMEVSLGSTIYRLNTIAVVILSVLFLGETLSLIKLAGITCGIIAVLLLYRHQSPQEEFNTLALGLWLVIAGAICRAIYGVVTKAGLSANADMDLMVLVSALFWLVGGFIYARFIERSYELTREMLGYIILSGCLVYGIVRTLVLALSLGEASVVITIANMSFLSALLIALALGMERLTSKKVCAMGFAVTAIALLSKA